MSAEEPGVGLEATPDATAGALVAIGCELPEEEDVPGCELPEEEDVPEEDAPDGVVSIEAKVAAARQAAAREAAGEAATDTPA